MATEAVSLFPESVWDGSSLDRDLYLYRPPSELDWEQLVQEIRALQQHIVDNYPQTATGTSTSGTPVNLTPVSPSTLVIPTGYTYGFFIHIIAKNTAGTKHASFIRRGVIDNESGTVALSGSVATIGTDINTVSWSVAITADDTNKKIQIACTGEATTHWLAKIDFAKVS